MFTKRFTSTVLLAALAFAAPWTAPQPSTGGAPVTAAAAMARPPVGLPSLLPFTPTDATDYHVSLDGVTADAYAFEPLAQQDTAHDKSMAGGIVGQQRGR
jgi:hypothetical protein